MPREHMDVRSGDGQDDNRMLSYRGVQRWMANCSQSAHGIGTARAMQMDYTMGTYSGLAMGLVAVINSIMVPQIWALMATLLLSAEP